LKRSGKIRQRGTGNLANTGNLEVRHEFNFYAAGSDRMTDAGPLRFGRIPSKPPRWRPRVDLLDQIRNPTTSPGMPTRQALVGGHGVGKTQLAAEFARECVQQGWDVIWLSLEESGESEQFSELAWALGLRIDKARSAADTVRSWLETRPTRLLLVLDNASDINELHEWLPTTGGARVIITSIYQAASNVAANVIGVNSFSISEAMDYLCSETGNNDRTGLEDLVRELGCLPLALAQAAWLIKIQGRSFGSYLDLLRSTEVSRVLKQVPGAEYPRGVPEAILLSVQECEKGIRGGWVQRILECSSVMSPTGIPRQIIEFAGMYVVFFPMKPIGDFDEAVGELVEASLVTLSGDQGHVVVHRLIQRVIRDRLRRQKRLFNVLSPVGAAMSETRLTASQPLGLEGLALAEQCIYIWQSFCEETGQHGIRLFDRLRRPLMKRRFTELRGLAAIQVLAVDFERGKQLGVAVLRDFALLTRGDLKTMHPWRRHIYSLMADLGRSDSAIPIAEADLAEAERILGKQHGVCLSIRLDLGTYYYTAYRFAEAIDTLERALRMEERVNAADSTRSHLLRQQLGNAYRAVGKLDEAREIQERATTGLPQAVDRNADLLWMTYLARRDLAITYRESGQRKKAASLLANTIRDCQLTHEAESVKILMFKCDLAMTFSGSNSPGKAVKLLEKSLPRLEKSLGPDILVRYHEDLATAYVESGRPTDAASVLERTISSLTDALGPEHGAVRMMRKRLTELRRV
jgi:tetratricopeptide (TPR) repeat protein